MSIQKKIHIARIFKHYTPACFDYYLYGRINQLDKSKFKTTLIYLDNISDSTPPSEHKGMKVYCLNDKRLKRQSLKTISKVRKIILENKIDILHCNQHGGTVYGTLASLFLETIIFSHMHGLKRCRSLKRKIFYYLASKKIRKVLACSAAVADDVAKNFPGFNHNIDVLPNSIDFEKYSNGKADKEQLKKTLGIDESAFLFLSVGRLVPTKSFDMLINAFNMVHKKNPNTCLLIAGDGRDKAVLNDRIKKLSLGRSVKLLGHRNDIPQLLKSCDCFVLSSCREGMPLVVMEAMASGISVVATNAGGTGEILGDSEYGTLIPTEDEQALMAAMCDVVKVVPSARKQMSEKAANHIYTSFNHQSVVNTLENLYLESLG